MPKTTSVSQNCTTLLLLLISHNVQYVLSATTQPQVSEKSIISSPGIFKVFLSNCILTGLLTLLAISVIIYLYKVQRNAKAVDAIDMKFNVRRFYKRKIHKC